MTGPVHLLARYADSAGDLPAAHEDKIFFHLNLDRDFKYGQAAYILLSHSKGYL
jgi:hypothetical protein